MPVIKHCEICDKIFAVKPSRSKAKFCSKECMYKGISKRVEVECKLCGKKFFAKLSSVKTYGRKYCSKKCSNYANMNGEITYCLYCGENPIYVCRANRNRGNGKFCSRKCLHSYHKGATHPSWRGGKTHNSGGYVLVIDREHPRGNKYNGRVFEHIIVVEKVINRYVKREEVIHHINEVRNDNRPENLYLFPSNAEHMRYHFLVIRGKVPIITESNLLIIAENEKRDSHI